MVVQTTDTLAAKTQELLELQTRLSQPKVVTPPAITLEQIQELIDQGVAKKLSELSGQPLPVVTKPLPTPLEIVKELFTGEEVTWLCNPTVLRGVDKFMLEHYIHTEEGKIILKQAFAAYRKYYDEK